MKTQKRLVIVLVLALLPAGCSSGDEAVEPTSTPATTQQTATTTNPASSAIPGPPPEAGIWLAELGVVLLQFRLDAGPDDSLTGVFDSPAEGVTDVPIEIERSGEVLTIEIPIASAVFEGSVTDDTMTGFWRQGGMELPLEFTRRAEPFVYNRSQEPQPPFPYTASDVEFPNGNAMLAGTVIIPEGGGPFPAAVLVSGSGLQDRNSTLLGHMPFLVLADALARDGIATLRYDDRGFGESSGNPVGATTADFATDALAAVEYLRKQEQIGPIGLIGHSEGGLIGPIVAGQSADVAFVVLLAGPGLPGADVLLRQTEDLLRAEGVPEDAIAWRMEWSEEVIALAASDEPTAAASTAIRELLSEAAIDAPPVLASEVSDGAIDQTVAAFTDPWMRFFLAYDPRPALRALEVPVLAVIGGLDLQVAAATNIPALDEALSTNPDETVTELPGLNHLFQTATTGTVSEYGLIAETMAPQVLELISAWILERFDSEP